MTIPKIAATADQRRQFHVALLGVLLVGADEVFPGRISGMAVSLCLANKIFICVSLNYNSLAVLFAATNGIGQAKLKRN
jgi:hypothetical protein